MYFLIDCPECQRRKEQMMAGDWKMDLTVLGIVLLIVFLLFKVKIT